ncbi:hypothetical protein COV05_04165 [Candidatus Uhrbacteria bacterium CG10_big_fil_rev_8_21_14_0_10_48_16]|uniref:Uncharacterized protein n=1 Tax=Candidatus Uhrbacteria bacterium CG10_big_fil_rev_8_21_14_0_10_48_16 TaxID=1975038 RepID=A0A2M8LGK8_9BACT|nr:MAG: hypothetical protein COV05_04165 [Candidatus Uhrbacteria bacterium CG10_big_fil_rev_8_21_14_0_10_48_16]
MQDLLEQIEKGLEANLYYLSLFVALAIPDICGAIDASDGEASKAKYIKWFDEHLQTKYSTSFNGELCYYFRCSLLHQGSSQHSKSRYKRIMFIEPDRSIRIHRSIMNDAYFIDVKDFCNDMVEACKGWLQKVETTPLFQTNSIKFIMRYPQGLKPYVSGVPVIG